MDLRRVIQKMRTRTALVYFLTAILMGELLTFAVGTSPAARSTSAARVIRGSRDSLVWRDFGAALAEAKSSRRRIVVDVYTDWCGWCKRMDRDTYAQPGVKKYLNATFVPVRLNAESNDRCVYQGKEYSYRELAGGFRVNGYPTTLFLEADGTHIVSAPGYMNAADFLTVLQYIGEGEYKNKDFDTYRAEKQAGADSSATSGAADSGAR